MRKLSPEDRRLWDFVTRSVAPLRPRHPTDDQDTDVSPPPKAHRAAVAAPEPAPVIHRAAHTQPLHVGHLIDLDAATAKKFRKGRMPCDARLDLHGLTLAQAHGTLVSFIRNQSDRGARCVLVITGKGAADPYAPVHDHPRGRIKAELMHWLNAAPLRHVILAVTEANPKQTHGGAVYVLLKRRDRIGAHR